MNLFISIVSNVCDHGFKHGFDGECIPIDVLSVSLNSDKGQKYAGLYILSVCISKIDQEVRYINTPVLL